MTRLDLPAGQGAASPPPDEPTVWYVEDNAKLRDAMVAEFATRLPTVSLASFASLADFRAAFPHEAIDWNRLPSLVVTGIRAKDAEVKVETLTEQVRTLTLRLALNDLAGEADLTDLDAAWKLAADDLRAVEVGEDGTVDTDRLGQIVQHVAERYPYLTSSPPPATTNGTDAFPPTEPSGSFDQRQAPPEGRPDRRSSGGEVPGSRSPPMTEASWQAQAACRGLDPDWWFSTRAQPTAKARKTCRGCPARQQCLSAALADPTLSGIWGGTTGRERTRMRARLEIS